MKRLIAVGLSVMLMFAATANSAQAQLRHGKMSYVNQTLQNNTSRQLTPFHLVSLAYQGYFKNQGIPSYGTFISEYHQMSIHAKTLVEAGIKANLLPADTLTNQKYLSSVDSQLSAFSSEG
ncbi:hypothetical protein [Calothrix sp. UHCC 0171]|uniref:hypothetical protein n=1 Tax=Calothrix sp. UHCC 0171 TaxID=3110245 RepID=UPI002B1F1C68|nr:hypothetical protein [Calothrix sp. UHCC 0171]MEA5572074.1 hypothetical protein [Calothrix sp. UHCC 0171]